MAFPWGFFWGLVGFSFVKGVKVHALMHSYSGERSAREVLVAGVLMVCEELLVIAMAVVASIFLGVYFTILCTLTLIIYTASIVTFGRAPTRDELVTILYDIKFFGRYVTFSRVGVLLLVCFLLNAPFFFVSKHAIPFLATLGGIGILWQLGIPTVPPHVKLYAISFRNFLCRERARTINSTYQNQALNDRFKDWSPNIVVVIAESLSSADSHRASGLFNNLPLLDAFFEKHGRIFPHYFSSARNSWGAHAHLFGGYRGLFATPTGSKNLREDAFPGLLKTRGYMLHAMSAHDARGNRIGELLQRLGFESLIGSGDFDDWTGPYEGLFREIPDSFLFQKALERLKSLRAPFLLSLTTVGGHIKPYLTDEKIEHERWEGVDADLTRFLTALQKELPPNTVVLVVGDHRKHGIPNKKEEDLFGRYGARHRAFLGIFGAGVQPGIDERLLCTPDLLFSLDTIICSEEPISNGVIVQPSRRTWLDPQRRGVLFSDDGIQFHPSVLTAREV